MGHCPPDVLVPGIRLLFNAKVVISVAGVEMFSSRRLPMLRGAGGSWQWMGLSRSSRRRGRLGNSRWTRKGTLCAVLVSGVGHARQPLNVFVRNMGKFWFQ